MRRGENLILKNEKKARKEGYKIGQKEGISFAVRNYSAVVLLCLKDKFGFTPEQLAIVADHINDMFGSVCAGYLTVEDIENTLKAEDDIRIEFNGEV